MSKPSSKDRSVIAFRNVINFQVIFGALATIFFLIQPSIKLFEDKWDPISLFYVNNSTLIIIISCAYTFYSFLTGLGFFFILRKNKINIFKVFSIVISVMSFALSLIAFYGFQFFSSLQEMSVSFSNGVETDQSIDIVKYTVDGVFILLTLLLFLEFFFALRSFFSGVKYLKLPPITFSKASKSDYEGIKAFISSDSLSSSLTHDELAELLDLSQSEKTLIALIHEKVSGFAVLRSDSEIEALFAKDGVNQKRIIKALVSEVYKNSPKNSKISLRYSNPKFDSFLNKNGWGLSPSSAEKKL